MRYLPPWTLLLCGDETFAAYTEAGAIELKQKDAKCATCLVQLPLVREQLENLGKQLTLLDNQIESYKSSDAQSQTRVATLTTQLKDCVAVKNTAKYAPTPYPLGLVTISALGGLALGAVLALLLH